MDGMMPRRRVRQMNALDLKECLERGEPVFKKWFPDMDAVAMYDVCLKNVDDPRVMLIRTDDAFGCATIDCSLQDPRLSVEEQWVFGPAWQVLSLLKEMIAWRDRLGAHRFAFGTLTDERVKILAKRLGKFKVIESWCFDVEDRI